MRKTLAIRTLGVFLMMAAPMGAQPTPPSPEAQVKLVIAAIQKGRETVPEAWDKGELNANLTVAALGSWELVNAGLALPSGDMKLAQGLVKSLLEHQPQILEKPSTLSTRVLLHLANYLGRQRDERAVALYEEVLSRQAKRAPEWPDEVDAALYNLAEYYSMTGQLQKAIDTKMRIYDYTTYPSLLANYELQIARLYSQAGDEQQATQWYETSEARGTPRAIGVSRMDRVESLFGQGKTAEARALLLKPLGNLSPEDSQKQPIQIALLTRVAQSYYAEGDMETAKSYVAQALALLKKSPDDPDPYVVAFGPMAQQLATRIETRQKSPFFWETESATLFPMPQIPMPQSNRPSQRLVLRFKKAPTEDVEFQCDNPNIRVEPVVAMAPGQNPLTRVVYIALISDGTDKDFTASLTAHDPEFPDQDARLPINVRVVRVGSPRRSAPPPPNKP